MKTFRAFVILLGLVLLSALRAETVEASLNQALQGLDGVDRNQVIAVARGQFTSVVGKYVWQYSWLVMTPDRVYVVFTTERFSLLHDRSQSFLVEYPWSKITGAEAAKDPSQWLNNRYVKVVLSEVIKESSEWGFKPDWFYERSEFHGAQAEKMEKDAVFQKFATYMANPPRAREPMPTAPATAASTVEAKLKQLKELYDKGLIDKASYDAKTTELLRGI